MQAFVRILMFAYICCCFGVDSRSWPDLMSGWFPDCVLIDDIGLSPHPDPSPLCRGGRWLRLAFVLAVSVWCWRQPHCFAGCSWNEIPPLAALGRNDSLVFVGRNDSLVFVGRNDSLVFVCRNDCLGVLSVPLFPILLRLMLLAIR